MTTMPLQQPRLQLPKIRFTRKNQLGILIILSALTATAQYMVQGSMASGGSPAEFDPVFWQIDYGLWGFRALIEAWVIIYCFSTQTKRWWEAVSLGVVEVALIALIFVTLGPALRALTLRQPITEILDANQLVWWTYGIAGYTSLMMAGVGFAYKVQPWDEALVPVVELETARQEAAAAEAKLNADKAALEGQLADTKAALDKSGQELNHRQTLLDQALASIETLKAQAETLKTQLEQAATGVSQDIVETLQSQLTLAQAEAQQVNDSLQTTMRELKAKNTQLESAQALVKTLTARVNNIAGEFAGWWRDAEVGPRVQFLLDNLVAPPYPRPAELAVVLGVPPAAIFPIYNEWKERSQVEA